MTGVETCEFLFTPIALLSFYSLGGTTSRSWLHVSAVYLLSSLQELVDKMFEAVSVTSCDIQREIISCIPEVIDDMQHVDVAHKLKLVQNAVTVI